MTPWRVRVLLSISIAMMLASCSPITDTRGQALEAESFEQIVAGQTTSEDVAALLGTPTTISNFGDETWYYITQKQERVGIFAPEVTEQFVSAIRFDRDKRVVDVARYSKEEGKPIKLVSKTTPTEGQNLGFFEQMLGNIGRFNSPASRGLSDRNRGR